MLLAKEQGIETVAFSLLSASIVRGDRSLRAVLELAVRTVSEHAWKGLTEVHLVAFTPDELRTLDAAVSSVCGGADDCDAAAVRSSAAAKGGAAEA